MHGIARARPLALAPRLTILDEAVSALDKSVEAQVLNLLIDLKHEFGLTYLFISHDLNVARFISDRVIVMYLGEVVESGPVEALWTDARHPYARAARGDAFAPKLMATGGERHLAACFMVDSSSGHSTAPGTMSQETMHG